MWIVSEVLFHTRTVLCCVPHEFIFRWHSIQITA
ncbi:unnamed protein product [Tenebrio molitor]|nr:unnamed protein product [Tenebrio molitor]